MLEGAKIRCKTWIIDMLVDAACKKVFERSSVRVCQMGRQQVSARVLRFVKSSIFRIYAQDSSGDAANGIVVFAKAKWLN
jgi:hypothetical protein